jgi:hypothetical protein
MPQGQREGATQMIAGVIPTVEAELHNESTLIIITNLGIGFLGDFACFSLLRFGLYLNGVIEERLPPGSRLNEFPLREIIMARRDMCAMNEAEKRSRHGVWLIISG